MRGLPPEEKMLMQRIGNMLDAALNNRQSSNPFEPSKNKSDRVLYPPTGLVAFTGVRTLKLVWVAANSDQHHYYEIFVTNTDTGEEETHKSFTNEFRFKGINGNYNAKVRSVGRDTKTSPWHETIEFTLGGSVMQIEGSKNAPTELGTMVQDHITVYDDYSVYVWGSEVLDKYAAGTSNETSVFRLWSMIGASQTFDVLEATLQQTITLYPATESASNLDAIARAGSITRPSGTRSGSFETSLSTMFSPIKVDTSEGEQVVTFFLEALGRTTELDEVNLSIVLWGGFDGLGDNVPGDPWDGGKSAYVFPHTNSLRVWREETDGNPNPTTAVTKGRWFMGQQAKEFNVIDNQWTLAISYRLESRDVPTMVDNSSDGPDRVADLNNLFRRSSYNATGDFTFNENYISVDINAVKDSGAPSDRQLQHHVQVTVGDANGTDSADAHIWNWTFPASTNASYMWAGDELWSANNYAWHFLIICFEGGPSGVFGSGTPKIRLYTNDRHADPDNPDDRYHQSPNGMCHLNQRVADGALNSQQFNPGPLVTNSVNQDVSNDLLYSVGYPGPQSGLFTNRLYDGHETRVQNGTFTIHQMGFWNVAIDNWDGMGFNPGAAEQRDSSPWYDVPYQIPLENVNHEDGRESILSGTSLTSIHYLFNQGYISDIDWKKNSNTRPDGAREYIFAENLIHLWQFGAVPEQSGDGTSFAVGDETLRDTGNYLYGGNIDFLSSITPTRPGFSSNGWCIDAKLSDIFSPARWQIDNPDINNHGYDPGPWASQIGAPNFGNQAGLVYGADDSDGPEGTTAHIYCYPGQGFRATETGGGSTQDWRRPNTGNTATSGDASRRTGVLNEPKTWDPKGFYDSVAASEAANGYSSWTR
jgi:hypothetical protein